MKPFFLSRPFFIIGVLCCFSLFRVEEAGATKCVFTSKILASNNPFFNCLGTAAAPDTIVIKDTLVMDINYEPIFQGVPFDGLFIVDGGVILWSSPVWLKLSDAGNARIILINGGHLYPGSTGDPGCSPLKTIYFGANKLASCSGSGALHDFSDVNEAGCITIAGICCNAYMTALEYSGNPNDNTVCQLGDSVTISVEGSGSINYMYFWSPGIGSGTGPYTVAQNSNSTSYSVSISGVFDPFGPEPPYVLTCGGTVTIKVNPSINLSATTTPVPCASSAIGTIDLTVSGGTAPYTYKWSNNKTTQDINTLVAGTYTVTVTDKKGCTAVKSATVITQDNTPPTLACPSNALDTALINQCTTPVANINAVFSDNCPAAALTYTLSGATTGSGSGQLSNVVPFSSGITTAKYFVNDGANTVSCTFTVTVRDIQLPTASNPPAITGILCFAEVPPPDPAVVTDEADNCGTPSVSFVSQNTLGGGGCPGAPLTILRRYRVTDNAGNSILVIQQVQVADSQPPAFTSIPADITVNCQSIPAPGTPLATDNCGLSVSIVYNGETHVNGSCADNYTLRRKWTATDNCGNTTTAEQLIAVQDITKPVFVTVPANITVNCQSIPAVATPTATDNCDGSPTITYTGEVRTDGACPDTYTLRRSWTAADNCGNTATAQQIISVQDITKPVFVTVPANVTVSCESIPAVGTPTASDNCDAGVAISFVGEVRTDGTCPDKYTLRRTWMAEDNCGNTATAEQLISIQDITKPVFVTVPADVTVNCQSVPVVGTPTATDNCDGAVTITFTNEVHTNGTCPDAYTLTRFWKAEDNCGNTATAQQKITVQDITKPVFTNVPANITVNCESVPGIGSPAATDNCDEIVTISYNGETRTNGACPDTYTLSRKWTATDNCGNTATAQQIITVQDITKPVFTAVPANVTVTCESVPSPGVATATDNCDGTVAISYNGETRTNGACPDTYILRRNWTATDNCGNSSTAEQVITVQDITKPVFTTVPANVTVSCESLPAVGTPAATDNCDASVTITYNGETRTDGACPDTYTLRRIWTAADNCANTATAEQVITVQDLVKPVFTFFPPNITASCESITTLQTPSATDNCDAAVAITYIGETRTDGACPDSYSLLRTWMAADNCGNTTTAVQTITVQDLTKPVFTAVPANITVSCESVPTVGTPTASDNCDAGVSISYDGEIRIDGACPDSYTLRRSWTATDNCGNSSTAEQFITVQDLTPPHFTAVPASVTMNCETVPPVDMPFASDNCDGAVTITFDGEVRIDGPCPDTYVLHRSWTALDNCGNTATTVQVITVHDITAPVFTSSPANVTVTCESVPAVGTSTATDNCDAGVTITYNGETRTDGNCPDTYILSRTWTAADNCGNTSVAEQIITVQDITKPVFTFVPSDVTVSCESVPAPGTPTATDNCDAGVTITYNGEVRTDGPCPDTYTLHRSWTAEDNCGNATTSGQTITVQDLSKPVFTFSPADITVTCESVPAVGIPTATDNCDAGVTITYNGEVRTDGPCPDTYFLRRSWTAEDNCSNSTSTEQIITVQDLTAPVFTFVPGNVTVSCEAIPAVGTPTATDNCDAGVTITYNGGVRTDGPCPDTYTLRRSWTVEDNCGNTTTAEQIITIQDLTAPVFTFVPAAITVSCEAVPPVESPTATDNCAAGVTITYNGEVRTDGACPDSYTLRRSWTGQDNCGNTATAEQIITVQDITHPVFTTIPPDVTVNCESVPPVGTALATDNCTANVTVEFIGEVRSDGNCPDRYTLTRLWKATDNCGNMASAKQVLTVQDTTKPVFTFVPADTTANCNSIPAIGTPTATDNCSADVTIVFNGETIMSNTSPDSYILRRLWTATDNCGNMTTVKQMLTVQDTVSPLIQCPANIVVDADGAICGAVVPFEPPVITDNCSSTLDLTQTAASGATFPIGTTVVVISVVDASGNTASCSFSITAVDTTGPVLVNCPPDLTVTTSGASCDALVTWTPPTVMDACDAYPITAVPNIPPGTVFQTGIVTITYTATDSTGNTLACSFLLTVKELIPPVLIDCPVDITLTTDTCTATANWIPPTATDNCSAITISTNIQPGTVFPETATTVTYTAEDVWGNTATCSFTVTVVDIVPPQFSGCPQDTVVDALGACSIPVSWIQPTATDNCTANPLVFSTPSPGAVFPAGYTTVHVFVQDPSGNLDTCTFKVTVIGPPLGLSDTPANQSFIGCSAVATWAPPIPIGVCGPVLLSSNYQPGSTFGIGTTEVIYTVSDTLGHVVSDTFAITVTESIAPLFTCPGSPIAVNISGAVLSDPDQFILSTDTVSTCDGVKLQFDFPQASDNCDVPQVSQITGTTTGAVFALGTQMLEFEAMDDAGNSAHCMVQIEVLPLEPLNPVISDKIACLGDDITLSTPVIANAAYIWTGPEAPYPNDNTLLITDLRPSLTGIYTVKANVNGCITPLDSALVRLGKLPVALDDLQFEVETNGYLDSINVLLNDIFETDDYTVTLASELPGLTYEGAGMFAYQAGSKNGKVQFIYSLCSDACPDLCDMGVVTINVREVICSYIPNIITPNGDGVNDYLNIPCLDTELYPDNTLIIYNQWGDKVFEANPYSNDPATVWRGTLRGEAGRDLPDGTYFYIFKPTDEDGGLKGFVEILR